MDGDTQHDPLDDAHQSEVADDHEPGEEEKRHERKRKLTEKALQNKIEELTKNFWKTARTSANEITTAQAYISDSLPDADLVEVKEALADGYARVEAIFEDLKTTSGIAPPHGIRTTVDRLKSDTNKLTKEIWGRLTDKEESLSILGSRSTKTSIAVSKRDSVSQVLSLPGSKHGSRRSKTSDVSSRHTQSSTSSKRRDAEAAAAARRAELEAAKERAHLEEELLQLEIETQRKKRELEQQRIKNELKIEEAKIKVYGEGEDVDRQSRRSTLFSTRLRRTQTAQPVSDATTLAEALAASISLTQIPALEPPVFDGDPLKYHDWSTTFRTLIEEKKIPEHDKIHYLKRYVSGPAKEAISGYFMLRSSTAFEEARALLEERYGNQFVVTEAFCDKLEAWPKVQGRDGKGLRRFGDFLQQCKAAMAEMKGLEILNDTRENRKMLQKLPDWIVNRWTRLVADKKKKESIFPPFSEFVKFIVDEATIACDPITSLGSLREVPEKEEKVKAKAPATVKKGNQSARTLVSETKETVPKTETVPRSCPFCDRNGHILNECRTFGAKTDEEKREYILKNGLCYGCLNRGHMSKSCTQKSTCKVCSKRHPTSLHMDKKPLLEEPREQKTETSTKQDKPKEEEKKATCGKISKFGEESMTSMIVPVWVSTKNQPQKEELVYALLDTMSDTTFVLDDTIRKLDLRTENTRLRLSTIAQDDTIKCRKVKGLQVRAFDSTTSIDLPVAYSRNYIPADTSHIPTPSTAKKWIHLKRIAHLIPVLQDCEVGLLIGYNCPQALAPRSYITGEGNQPFALQTDLGWSIIGGSDRTADGAATAETHRITVKEIKDDLTSQLAQRQEVRFVAKTTTKEVMDIEPAEIVRILESDFRDTQKEEKPMSQDDLLFLDKISDGIHQQEDGHYSMPLPFKSRPNLPNNRHTAVKRFEHLSRRFRSDPKYYRDYKKFMTEIIERGDAEKIPPDEAEKEQVWYIPHHGVYHPKKPDKIRVVFDCSSRYKGTSLNDHLLQGPDLTNSLVGVLIRFRQEKIAVSCDVEKMFHQFRVNKEDRDYLRFIWEDGDYRMKVHLFGATSSPGCANFGLKQLAKDHEEESVEAAKFIRRNFYVDDGLTSAGSVDTAKKLVLETKQMCTKGNLRLHKFVSNSREVMEMVPPKDCAQDIENLDLTFGDLPMERVLGIQWCVRSDTFQFGLELKDQPTTRRGILSTIASVYDPLGFLAPFVLRGKQILQEMCREGTGWDDPLPSDLEESWRHWRANLTELAKIRVPRCYQPETFGRVKRCELHHFSDASTTGYGQCSYIRVIDENDQIHCSLVMGKARVTPLRVVTIPRLELQAAVTTVKISNLLRQELEFADVEEYFWTDSKVTLGYIQNDARRFHVYVANRVQKIRQTTDPDQWFYVPTDANPADHASRGLGVEDLISSNWFTGPDFLWGPDLPTDRTITKELQEGDPEVKSVTVHAGKTEEATLISRIEHFSDWTRVVKGITALQRFLSKKKKTSEENPPSITEERRRAEQTIIKMVQEEAFAQEIQLLKTKPSKNEMRSQSQLARLDPFLDENGILRVGGRLTHSSTLHHEMKYPAILPKKGHVTDLVVKYCHEKVAHQGRGMTVNEVRSNGFWIIGLGSTVAYHIHRCVQCRKLRGPTEVQKMADLPEERLEPTPPFTYCGFDCFGPFIVKERRKELKKYGLLFTCMASRAIHIEMLDDMSTDAFINALRCFIALRGKVRQLRSDRGTNFVGAENELKRAFEEIKEEKVKSFLMENGCDFVSNVPSASHMGGVWERQIRTVRSVLTATLRQDNSRLDGSSLRTYFYEAMAIVNSRPLSVENQDDPCGPTPLTPNDLLTMKTGVTVPPPGDFPREDVYARRRWRRVQYLANQFWTRWKKEYLSNLQVRRKWNKARRNLEEGDIVLVKDEDLVRSHWKMARVVETMASKDGLVRKVKLLMSDSMLSKDGRRVRKASYLERPIHKLTVLIENSKNI